MKGLVVAKDSVMAPKKQQAVTGLSSKAEREADLVMGVRKRGILLLICDNWICDGDTKTAG